MVVEVMLFGTVKMLKLVSFVCLLSACAEGLDNATRDEAIQRCFNNGGLFADLRYHAVNTSNTDRTILEKLQNGESIWTSKYVYSKFYSWVGCVTTEGENDLLQDVTDEREKIQQCLQACSNISTENNFLYFGIGRKSCFCFEDLNPRSLLPLSTQCQTKPSSVSVYRLHHDRFSWSTGNRLTQQCVYATRNAYRKHVQYGTTSCDGILDGLICSRRDAGLDSFDSRDLTVALWRSSFSQARDRCKEWSKILLWTEIKQVLHLQPLKKYWTGLIRSYTLTENNNAKARLPCLSLKRVDEKLVEIPDDCDKIKHVLCSTERQRDNHATTELLPDNDTETTDRDHDEAYTKSGKQARSTPSVRHVNVSEDSKSDTSESPNAGTNSPNGDNENSSQSPTGADVTFNDPRVTDDKTNSDTFAFVKINGVLIGVIAAFVGTVLILLSVFTVCTLKKLRSQRNKYEQAKYTVKYTNNGLQTSKIKRYVKNDTQNETSACCYIHPAETRDNVYHELKSEEKQNTYDEPDSEELHNIYDELKEDMIIGDSDDTRFLKVGRY